MKRRQLLEGALAGAAMLSVPASLVAGNPGQWAFHCHHLYHMVTRMMSTFVYRT